jgi:hypothetical protein
VSADTSADSGSAIFTITRAVPEAEAARISGPSVAPLRRMRQAGGGPRHTRMDRGRIGYPIGPLPAWLRAWREADGAAASGVVPGTP